MTTLSNPSSSSTQTSVTASVTTDEGLWHLYYAIRTSGPYGSGDEQIIKDGTGAVFASRLSHNLNPTGVNTVQITDLNPSTQYYVGFVQEYNDTNDYGPLWDYPLVHTTSTLPYEVVLVGNHIKENLGQPYGFALLSAVPDPGTISCSPSGDVVATAGTPDGVYNLDIRAYNSDSRNDGEMTLIVDSAVSANFYLVPEVIDSTHNGKTAEMMLANVDAPRITAIRFSSISGEMEIDVEGDLSVFGPGSHVIIVFIEPMVTAFFYWNGNSFVGDNPAACAYVEASTVAPHSMPMNVTFRNN
jgi:hypothetical protein